MTTNIESLHSIKSNEQRLKSLHEYEQEKQTKKRLIKDSLTNPNQTTHLKFDSDNEDDHAQPKIFEKKKIQLFDDNEGLNVEEHFPQKKTSKKRKKLQDLQARLTTTNDPRFQFSEQFLDEHDKTIESDDEHIETNNNEHSFEDEKKKSLAILDQMAHAKPSKPKPATKMIRFDPSKTEHQIYELNSEVKTNGEHRKKFEEIQTKTTAPIVDSTRTYDFDESKLKSLFNKTPDSTNTSNNNGLFQFQFFNHQQSNTISEPKIITSVPNGKVKSFQRKFDDAISDEDDHEKSLLPEESKKPEENINETFFFFDIDTRLKDGLENFVRTEDLNELERTWPTKRKEISEALRTKHRKALQRKDKHRVFNHRRRQTQYPQSKSDHV